MWEEGLAKYKQKAKSRGYFESSFRQSLVSVSVAYIGGAKKARKNRKNLETYYQANQ